MCHCICVQFNKRATFAHNSICILKLGATLTQRSSLLLPTPRQERDAKLYLMVPYRYIIISFVTCCLSHFTALIIRLGRNATTKKKKGR